MGDVSWSGQHVYVLGYGVEGRSSAAFMLARGAVVHVRDEGSPPDGLPPAIDFRFGADAFADIDLADLLVRSPGINPEHPALAGIDPARITSQTSLFLNRWRHRSIGVTGSKGKGTTVSLIAAILAAAGQKHVVAGNIGAPMLDMFDRMDDRTWAVLELSSFQLQDISVSPHIAVVLTITPEHLNYHKTFTAYRAAKARIAAYQHPRDVAVINADNEVSWAVADVTPAAVRLFGHGSVNAVIKENAVYLGSAAESPIAALDDVLLRGPHNLQNIAAASLVSRELGVSDETIRQAVRSFQPLPHRLQPVGRVGNAVFVNDSFATTPEASVAALRSFSEPAVLIVGGSDKGSEWTVLVDEIERRWAVGQMIGVVGIGETGPQVAAEISGRVPALPVIVNPGDMSAIVAAAWGLASQHEVAAVILSPGAASFGMFTDYKERGRLFTEAASAVGA
jgi:UDP-N-acetylmuramoylalanine--D-glutamate ligase